MRLIRNEGGSDFLSVWSAPNSPCRSCTRQGRPRSLQPRTGTGPLTPAGLGLLPAARRALTDPADGLAAARAVGGCRAGRLRIGFAASLAPTVLPGLLRTFRERFPRGRLDIREMTKAPQLAALRDRTIDIGLLREPPPRRRRRTWASARR
ncbi:LysR substrate-binding domain-containing protein [Streptomyces sp. NPDC007808]|uniref:LysR substrate-binding domain-containing protein n=1 Tax=Streptomyces sp. NPDC007808 TaxID=3364779 RepID=UPI00369FFF4E